MIHIAVGYIGGGYIVAMCLQTVHVEMPTDCAIGAAVKGTSTLVSELTFLWSASCLRDYKYAGLFIARHLVLKVWG